MPMSKKLLFVTLRQPILKHKIICKLLIWKSNKKPHIPISNIYRFYTIILAFLNKNGNAKMFHFYVLMLHFVVNGVLAIFWNSAYKNGELQKTNPPYGHTIGRIFINTESHWNNFKNYSNKGASHLIALAIARSAKLV